MYTTLRIIQKTKGPVLGALHLAKYQLNLNEL